MEHAESKLSTATPRWLHAIAVAAAVTTFPLVIVGGLVTTTRVGMADTVWPTPPWYFVWLVAAGQAMDRGLGFLIEHGHRQLGWIVGALTLTLAVALWFREARVWVRWLGVVALGAVIAQGVLGGLRVLFVNQAMALVHGVIAQLFFSLLVCLAAFTSARWSMEATPVNSPVARRLQRLSLLTTSFVFLQLVFGATLRHFGYTWALVAHLTTAFMILLHVALIAKRIYGEHAQERRLVRPLEWLGGLVLGQLMLGAGAWATSSGFGLNAVTAQSGPQIFFATAHVSVGALILAICALLTTQTYRLLVHVPDTEKGDRSRSAQQRVARPSISSLESRELWTGEVTA
jgi:cytochrome c oxidase assembly protein subunit 15